MKELIVEMAAISNGKKLCFHLTFVSINVCFINLFLLFVLFKRNKVKQKKKKIIKMKMEERLAATINYPSETKISIYLQSSIILPEATIKIN